VFQVDAFWSYGIGAGYALASAGQLASAGEDAIRRAAVCDRQLALTLLFLGVVFLPMGLLLATRFPRWETMYVLTEIPPWAMACFGAGVFLSGALGCLITLHLLVRGALWTACLQLIGAYTGMCTVLVHGWDGTGLHRFLAAAPKAFPVGLPTTKELTTFAASPVAATLVWMGMVLMPVMLLSYVWCRARRPTDTGSAAPPSGVRDPARWRPAAQAVLGVVVLLLGTCPVLAVATSVSVQTFGLSAGGVLALVVAASALHPRGPLAHHFRVLVRPTPRPDTSPVATEDAVAEFGRPRRPGIT
jgi:hypothetical protein